MSVTRAICAAGVLIFLVGNSASAEDSERSLLMEGGDRAIISSISEFHIQVIDQVSDGCLPRPTALKDAAEVVLRRNGFRILEEKHPLMPSYVINALGYGRGEYSCVVYLETQVVAPRLIVVPHAPENDDIHTIATYRIIMPGQLLSGQKSGMQARLQKAADQSANDLYLTVSRSRDKFFTRFPEVEKELSAIHENGN